MENYGQCAGHQIQSGLAGFSNHDQNGEMRVLGCCTCGSMDFGHELRLCCRSGAGSHCQTFWPVVALWTKRSAGAPSQTSMAY